MRWMDPVALQRDKIYPCSKGSVILSKMIRVREKEKERKNKGRKKEMERIDPVAL